MPAAKDKERVVITGVGIVCPLGNDVETVWQAILAGKSGAAKTTVFDASTFPTTFDAEVKEFDFRPYTRCPEIHAHASRSSKFAIGAAVQACRQAGIDVETDAPSDGIDRAKVGIYLGAGEGQMDAAVFFGAITSGWESQSGTMNWKQWTQTALALMSPNHELEQEPNMAAAHIGLMVGARGPVRSCLTACAASTQAVGEAAMLIRHGQAEVMITGGTHSMIHPLGVTGFNRLTALSTRNESPQTASRPFSAGRDGFVLGEGAAILVLESLESARRRNASALAEVIGYGASADAFRVTDMHEEARGPVQAMRAALDDANISPENVDYISTHGTSTTENDSIETLAIKTVFGKYAKQVAASSVKSMLGHLIAAAGAAELITCVLAIRDGIVPATINLDEPDPALDLDYVPNKPRRMPVRVAMNESFGFGGQNNVVIIKKYDAD